jgi:hypothetical protein
LLDSKSKVKTTRPRDPLIVEQKKVDTEYPSQHSRRKAEQKQSKSKSKRSAS